MLFDSIHLFGCIHLPDFPVQASLRGEPSLSLDEVRTSFKTVPVAVLDGPIHRHFLAADGELERRAEKRPLRRFATRVDSADSTAGVINNHRPC